MIKIITTVKVIQVAETLRDTYGQVITEGKSEKMAEMEIVSLSAGSAVMSYEAVINAIAREDR